MTFAKELRDTRQELGMSQVEFAKLLKTTQRSISYYERGRMYPNPENMKRFRKIIAAIRQPAVIDKRPKTVVPKPRPVKRPSGVKLFTPEEIQAKRAMLWGLPPGKEAADGDVTSCCPKDCYFRGATNTCDYILVMELPRPCQIGKRCTVYVPSKNPRKRASMMTIMPEHPEKGVLR